MITTQIPGDWRALQEGVARILRECGFSAQVEKTMSVARGQVEVDVYAEEQVKGRNYTILVECKNWRSAVPQSVIHSFRTVVADSGANLGYIVSAAGFQSGALTAASQTNVRLLDWAAFQAEFEPTWIERHLVPFVTDEFDTLITYTEPLLPTEFIDRDPQATERLAQLRERYAPFGVLMAVFTRWARLVGTSLPELPLSARLPPQSRVRLTVPSGILDARGYREFLETALRYRDTAMAEFGVVLKGVAG